ncbi:uncharacterized protein GGS25DRAFT_505309 [Hypoxylon fragiforme]|uniref:uncharacterized protein n=1 Tax=Hypoxylon fragiforme TaxID=63214 RepID=UPI0020C6CD86|nr:uncharacterized protein GGS25DRAFT_505309 [Hypoxylon fragiforme]KAI2605490.1 hypothetical protein GGS25DRAFT_505309 [Hypoxylon fragiforme]
MSSLNNELLPTSDELLDRARKLLKLIDSWVKYRIYTPLEELVGGIHHIHQMRDIRALIDIIPNCSDTSSSWKAHFLNMIRSQGIGKQLCFFTVWQRRFL